MKKEGEVRAIGLLSGGLDSTLAHALIKAQGISVKAVTFYTGFCIVETQRRMGRKRADGTVPRNDALHAAASLETELELVDISGPDYLEIVANPKYGYGANANPCIDCRIFMFKRAKELAEEWQADFIFTGEVMGQRPKSQRRETMRLIEKASGLEGKLLRPLSAKVLEPTEIEKRGLVDRERLLGFSGRSRKPQMELAKELGIADYPQPAGGCCFLTDETFGRRFHDLLNRRPDRRLAPEEIPLLATGRHFRLSESAKLIVGRNEAENSLLAQFCEGEGLERRRRVEALEVMGPVAIVEGEPDAEQRAIASRIVARYGQGWERTEVRVRWSAAGAVEEVLAVAPMAKDAEMERWRI